MGGSCRPHCFERKYKDSAAVESTSYAYILAIEHEKEQVSSVGKNWSDLAVKKRNSFLKVTQRARRLSMVYIEMAIVSLQHQLEVPNSTGFLIARFDHISWSHALRIVKYGAAVLPKLE